MNRAAESRSPGLRQVAACVCLSAPVRGIAWTEGRGSACAVRGAALPSQLHKWGRALERRPRGDRLSSHRGRPHRGRYLHRVLRKRRPAAVKARTGRLRHRRV